MHAENRDPAPREGGFAQFVGLRIAVFAAALAVLHLIGAGANREAVEGSVEYAIVVRTVAIDDCKDDALEAAVKLGLGEDGSIVGNDECLGGRGALVNAQDIHVSPTAGLPRPMLQAKKFRFWLKTVGFARPSSGP